jgi:integrase
MDNEKHQSAVYNADGVEFTIYQTIKPTKSGPRVYWLLEDYSTGKRRLLNNKTLKAARQRADRIRAAMVKGQANRMTLSEGEWQGVCIARELVRSLRTGDSVGSAVREWADCTARLGDRASLLDATKFYLSHHRNGGPPPQPTGFADAAERYHKFKLDAGKSKGHCKNIKSQIDRLLKALPPGVRLDELTAGQLDAVVVAFGVKEKTLNEYRIMLSNLYSWAAKQNPPLVAKGFNPAKDMERHKVKHGEVEFLRVGDLRKILVAAQGKRPELVPLIVLVCFAGLRPSEAVRLDWCEVGADYIRIPGKKSKTGYSRQIPIQENLKAWLALWRKNAGLICLGIDLPHFNVAIRHISGVCLNHDGMRHGYGTHRHKVLRNVGAVADEMGNTVQVCRRHYLNAFCTEQEAVQWFSIMPEPASNIINMPIATEVPSVVTGAKAI